MKVGRTVWLLKNGKAKQVKLKEFGKGNTALVELPDGTEKEVQKVFLHAKEPKAA